MKVDRQQSINRPHFPSVKRVRWFEVGNIVALDARVRPVVGHGVEVEVERLSGEQRLLAEHARMPRAEQSAGVPGGVREEYSLR